MGVTPDHASDYFRKVALINESGAGTCGPCHAFRTRDWQEIAPEASVEKDRVKLQHLMDGLENVLDERDERMRAQTPKMAKSYLSNHR